MKFTRKYRDKNYYHFICEACGEEGKLGLPDEPGSGFSCPNCNAMYIQWRNLENKPDLMCVVKPIFDEAPFQ